MIELTLRMGDYIPDDEKEIIDLRFETEEEVNAFFTGVAMTVGYSKVEVLEDSTEKRTGDTYP